MSLFVQALALLPAVAAVIVVLAALADRREAHALNDLRALDPMGIENETRGEPESCAA